VSSDRLAVAKRDHFGRVRRSLAERAVGSVLVVMAEVVMELLFELAALTDSRREADREDGDVWD
jgi:hypothetical protein